jgi:O-antigen/teichoic acid export membrane protein
MTEFVVGLALARAAGAEILGEFTTLVILAGLFAFISAFGLPSLLTREISRVRDDTRQLTRLVNAAVGLVVLLAAPAVALMLVVGLVSGYSPLLLRALALTATALTLESAATVVASAFRGVEEIGRSSTVSAVMELSFLLLALVAILLGLKIDSIMATYAASRLAALALAIAFYRSRFGRLRPTLDRTVWSVLLRKGFPFSLNSVFAFAYSRGDVVVLSYLAGNVAVGFYEAAYSLTMRMNLVARAITFALYPLLSLEFTRDQRPMRAYAATGIRYLNLAGFLIVGLVWVFGQHLALLIYGARFAAAIGTALRLLALAIPLRFLETQLGITLDASNRSGKRATAVLVTGVTNMALNVLLIPRYGMMGAVYSTLASEVIICGVFIWFLRDAARDILEWRAFVGPAAGAALVILGPTLLGGLGVWVLTALAIPAYFAVIVVLDQSSLEPLLGAVGRAAGDRLAREAGAAEPPPS